MSNIKEKLKKGQNLSFKDSKILFSELMEGKHDESSIIDILENLSMGVLYSWCSSPIIFLAILPRCFFFFVK